MFKSKIYSKTILSGIVLGLILVVFSGFIFVGNARAGCGNSAVTNMCDGCKCEKVSSVCGCVDLGHWVGTCCKGGYSESCGQGYHHCLIWVSRWQWVCPGGVSTCESDSDCPCPCSVTATASPNPIPSDKDETVISAKNLEHTSLDKCSIHQEGSHRGLLSIGNDKYYSLPHTFTQTEASRTYRVKCDGGVREDGSGTYDSCSDTIRVTKRGDTTTTTTEGTTTTTTSPAELSVTLTAEPMRVDTNENVLLTATLSVGQVSDYNWDWYIDDPDISSGQCHLFNPEVMGHFKRCSFMEKMNRLKNGGNVINERVINNSISFRNSNFSSRFVSFLFYLLPLPVQSAEKSQSIIYQWSKPGNYKVRVTITKKTH